MKRLTEEQLTDILYKHLGDMATDIEIAFGERLEASPADEMKDTETQIFNELLEYFIRCMDYTAEE